MMFRPYSVLIDAVAKILSFKIIDLKIKFYGNSPAHICLRGIFEENIRDLMTN
jgi:hypothetical protein